MSFITSTESIFFDIEGIKERTAYSFLFIQLQNVKKVF